MCGITGVAVINRRVCERELVQMRDILRHRGPDGEGLYIDENIGLAHRRLSIVDVEGGHQPMANENGSVHIVFNGEIYNHAQFRAELESKGHIFKSHCDTETIIHLYEEYGAGLTSKLRGMFAFAIWDRGKQELLVVRDRLGVKPLYYAMLPDGSLYFASEIKSLLEAEGVNAVLNTRALPDYLANHAPSGEQTLFAGVKRLLPGHYMVWSRGKLTIEKYWDIQYLSVQEAARDTRTDEDCIEEWKSLFRTSVELRLMADVPLGMFLSGGIDSAAIAATMSGLVNDRIKTFSVAFDVPEANELSYARIVSEKFRTDHHEIVVSPGDFFDSLPKMIWHEDEPLAHPSSIALNFVSKLAAQHVKVVLSGEGSDEMLAGYDRYRKTIYNLAFGLKYHGITNERVRNAVRTAISNLPLPQRFKRQLSRTFLFLNPDIESIYLDNFSVFSRDLQTALFKEEFKEEIAEADPYAEVRRHLSNASSASLLNRLLYADSKSYLHELLMKQDQMSMAASIESRVPFLDHELVEFTARLPDRLKLNRLKTKYVLRESMRNELPAAILSRRKMGFPVPISRWFRGEYSELVEEYVGSERSLSRGLFERRGVRSLIEQHRLGTHDHAQKLWSLMNLEMWHREFLD